VTPSGALTGNVDDAMVAAEVWVVPIQVLDEVSLGDQSIVPATDLAFDGTYIWYGNAYSARNQLVRYNFSSKSEVGSLPVSVSAWGLGWDGTNLWASSNGYDTVQKIDMTSGNTLTSSVAMGAWIPGIAWDGSRIWAVSGNEQTLYEYNPATNTVVTSTPINTYPGGLEWYGGSLYMTVGDTVQKMNTGTVMATKTYSLKGVQLTGITYDGTSWYLMAVEDDRTKILKVNLP